MKIPIFEEIPIKEMDDDNLRLLISESRIGMVPTDLNLNNLKKEERDLLILKIEQIILEFNIHPLFPYPIYIISSSPVETIFPWVKNVKDLPGHFFKKIKRPNNKELQLLNRLYLKVSKIKNQELYKKISTYRETSVSQKILYAETKEIHFLELLDANLLGKQKK